MEKRDGLIGVGADLKTLQRPTATRIGQKSLNFSAWGFPARRGAVCLQSALNERNEQGSRRNESINRRKGLDGKKREGRGKGKGPRLCSPGPQNKDRRILTSKRMATLSVSCCRAQPTVALFFTNRTTAQPDQRPVANSNVNNASSITIPRSMFANRKTSRIAEWVGPSWLEGCRTSAC